MQIIFSSIQTMRTRNHLNTVLVWVALLVAAGCAGLPVSYTSENIEGTSYEQAWNATLEVLRSRFPIAETSMKEGTITTDYKSRPVEGSPYQYRWKAVAHVSAQGDGATVKIRTVKERLESRLAFGAVPAAAEQPSLAQEREYGPAYYGGTYPPTPVWTDIGRDRQMELELLQEIKGRLQTH